MSPDNRSRILEAMVARAAQVEVLKNGVEAWKQWRQEHPDEKVDLSEKR